MNIMLVDDERPALQSLKRAIIKALPNAVISSFTAPSKAIGFVHENQIDVVFLDIEMGGINGLTLAKAIKDIHGETNIVFVTGYSQYAVDAFDVSASDYLLKPVSPDAIAKAMGRLRNPVKAHACQKIMVQTFGNFEVFTGGKPMGFARSKTKELFAYLISRRGALCSNNEIISVIWEDTTNTNARQSHFRHLVSDLSQALKAADADDILIRKRGGLALNTDAFGCDFYDFLRGDASAVNRYTGEFMAQYSWAEFTNGYLEQRL